MGERERFEVWLRQDETPEQRAIYPTDWHDPCTVAAWDGWQEAARQERERLDAIERMGPNGTLRIDDEHGLCPRYIHWGGSTGLSLRDAIDAAAIRSRSSEG